jgi:pimeloyl-ACP methyl ester carboxylesterase
MTSFVPWDSQPLAEWAQQHARGKFIGLDGHQTHYIEKGEGEPVILIHGFFYDTHMWDDNIDALAEHFKVYVIDLWGFGYSTRENLDVGYPLYSRQLSLFLDAMKIEKANLIGQSMGGGTIVHYAANYGPEQLKKVVLVEPSILPNKVPAMGQISILPGVGEFLFGMNSNFMRKMTLGNTFIYKKELLTPAYVEKVTRFQKVENSTRIMLRILRKKFFFTLENEVRQFGEMEVPTLVVAGQQSAGISPELSRQVHQIIKGSQFKVYDSAGHCPHDDQSLQFNRDVLAFLGS